MNYPQLFGIIRESLGITLESMADKLGITRFPIQKFEKTGQGISRDKIITIAKTLNIDDGFINDRTIYPFGQNNYFKLFMLTKGLLPGFPGYEPLYTIIEFANDVEIVSLKPQWTGLKKYSNRSIFETPTYAIAIRDTRNNIFLLRRKKESDVILWGGGLKTPLLQILEIAKSEARSINLSFAVKQIDDKQYDKLRNKWDKLKKEDVEQYFSKLNFKKVYEPTVAQIEILEILEKENIQHLSNEDVLLIKKLQEYKNTLSAYEVIYIMEKEIKNRTAK